MRNRAGLGIYLFILLAYVSKSAGAQDATAPKPAIHVIGPVTSENTQAGTITVKGDKDGQEYTFTLTDTKTLLKVPPGSKDLKSAVRITAQDLQAGDRVDVRYFEGEAGASPIPARSVLLMSARELQQAHQQEAAEWQNSTAGSVTAIDNESGTVTMQVRSVGGPKTEVVHTTAETTFTRYSPDTPSVPAKSSLAELHVGDQLRVIANEKAGDASGDTLQARKIYSGAFHSVPGTVVSVDPASNSLVVKDLRSKQTLTVSVRPETMLRKLPPTVAAGLARRLNPGQGGANAEQSGSGGAASHGAPQTGAEPEHAPQRDMQAQGGAGGAAAGMHGGDPSKMLEHMPAMALTDLKPGDAVYLTVADTKDSSRPAASAIIAGVEPIFQSAAPGRAQASGGTNWSLDMGIPAQ